MTGDRTMTAPELAGDPGIRDRLRALARRYRPPAAFDTDDLVQTAYVALLENLDDFDPARSGFHGWMTRTARWAMLDMLRVAHAGTRRHPATLVPLDGAVDEPAAPDELADVGVLYDQAVGCLAGRECAVVVLHAQGWLLRELGQFLGITESRVSQIRQAALGRARHELAVAGHFERQDAA